ncbi:unnamed protein product [Calypogeia fissa]
MGLKVVVTGASSGIGRATAVRFAKDGHDVFITARSQAGLDETASLAKGEGHGTVYKGVGDVQVPADVLKNYEEAIKALGHIDVIVLNAGMGWTQNLEDYSVEDFDTIINTNLKGAFLWLKTVLPTFKKRKSGQIVIVNSIFGLNVTAKGFSIYSASKHALTVMAEGLRMEVAGTGIKVAKCFQGLSTLLYGQGLIGKRQILIRNSSGSVSLWPLKTYQIP